MFLDATYLKGRVNHQVVSRAVVVATGVSMDGHREVLGCAVGDSEDGAFWTEFLRSLRARGLGGVRLVISDQHLGLKAAVEAVMVGSAWQRCRVHFMRNVLTRVKRNNTHMVIAAIQTIFAQPDARAVREQFERIVATLDDRFPDVATMLTDAKEDLLAFSRLPRGPLAQGLVDQSARASPPRDQATHRRGRGVPQRCLGRDGWSPPWWSRPTTNGRWPSAATCRRPRWPCSDAWRRQPSIEAPDETLESRPLAG